MLFRFGLLVLVSLALLLLVWMGKSVVERQRKRAFAAAPLVMNETNEGVSPSTVRILAFSSEDCVQCHTLQAPAFQRLQQARGSAVSIVDIDAPTSPELTHRYRVLTVPTTVVLDAKGQVHAVNYGFANTQRLLAQVDEAIAKAGENQSA
jgi:thioredoxin-related protein